MYWEGIVIVAYHMSVANSDATPSAAYRYLPVMMIWCVVLVCVLNRDFGCMLTSEKMMSGPVAQTAAVNRLPDNEKNKDTGQLTTNSTEEDCGELRSGASDRSPSQDPEELLMDGR